MALKQCEAPFPDESSEAGSYATYATSPHAAESVPPHAATTRRAEGDARQHAEAPGTLTESDATAAQLAANRSNAKHSTGPKTPEGKARTAQNARKHGLFSQDVVEAFKLEGEGAEGFEALCAGLVRGVAPEDRRERDMVERLASLTWRLDCLNRKMLEQLAALHNNWFPLDQLKYWDLLGKIEARTSREASKIHRDIAFLQRYRLDRRERVQKLDDEVEDRMKQVRQSEKDMLLLQLEVGRMNGTLPPLDAAPAASPSASDDTASPASESAENLPGTAPKGVDPVEFAAWKDLNEQLRRERRAKQTQFASGEASETPPKPDDGSNDLT